MAEALKQAGNGHSATSVRPQAGEDRSAAPNPQAAEGPEPGGIRLTAEQLRARRARSIAIALALGGFVLVIFAVTMVKLGPRVLSGPDYMRPVQPGK